MERSNLVKHSGVIEKIDNNTAYVAIAVTSACSACHIKSACSISDSEKKVIEVKNFDGKLIVGERVIIAMKSSLGFKALFLGYLLPFLILMITLIVSMSLSKNEGISALFSIIATGMYYLTLSFFKNSLKKTFSYQLEKYISN